jgi:hypothetical protein
MNKKAKKLIRERSNLYLEATKFNEIEFVLFSSSQFVSSQEEEKSEEWISGATAS